MVCLNGFTRQEAIALAGCNGNRLNYLEALGLVIPERIGYGRKPVVVFSWIQLIQIRLAENLKGKLPARTIKKVVESVANDNPESSFLKDSKLVVVNDQTFWMLSMAELGVHIASLAQSQATQFDIMILDPLPEIVAQIWEAARRSDSIDFESFKARARRSLASHIV